MVAMHRSRGGDEIDVAVIPMTALQLDQGHARTGTRNENQRFFEGKKCLPTALMLPIERTETLASSPVL
jgi:hypothetical protein